ncbi:MAG: hypothetical protein ACKVX9_22395 [Blastocatellia bacterium]
MNTKFAFLGACLLALGLSLPLTAQTPVVVQRADLSIPFGTVSGKLVIVSDHLVFVDNDRQENSFAIARNEIQEFKTENDVVMISTRRPIRTRGEEMSQFSFRLRDGSSESLTVWAGMKSAVLAAAAPAVAAAAVATATTQAPADLTRSGNEQEERFVYNAKHSHSMALVPSGSCTGKLIITRDRVIYESLENREHTRQWPVVDLKKVKRNNPYRIEIEPFNRDKYTLELEGAGMDISVFKKLENWIVTARTKS